MPSKQSILFFSTGDSTRSQIAAAFFSALVGQTVDCVSTAVRAKAISPLAAEIMREVGIDISGQRSKTVSETFRRHFTCVIAICEMPKERCPLWPFTRQIFKWNIIDPVTSMGSSDPRELLRRVRDQLRANVEEFVHKTLPTLQARSMTARAGGR